VRVPPRNTSRTCHACGHVDEKSRKTRDRFVCTDCGHEDHADLNAAKNIRRCGTMSPPEDLRRQPVEPSVVNKATKQEEKAARLESPPFRAGRKSLRQISDGHIGEKWRRERDSNPRHPLGVYGISSAAPSTTRPPLRSEFLMGTFWNAFNPVDEKGFSASGIVPSGFGSVRTAT
jgi:hypothetical protein